MRKSQIIVAAGTAVGLSAAVMAQNADRGVWGYGTLADNPGDLVGGPINVELVTGENGNLGIQYLNGTYWVSTRGAGPHHIDAFDAFGNGTGVSFDQVAGAQSSAWGYRDGASDGTFLYFGWENGVARHNADGSGGTQIISGLAPGGVGTYRALAHDPDLNGGAGGFWVQSFTSSLAAVNMSGGLLVSFANNGSSLYGLALADGRLFGHDVGGDIVEINRNDGSLMGTIFNVAGSFTSYATAGGLSEVPGGGFGSGNPWDLAVLGQGAPDEFAVFELVPAPGAIALLGMGGLLMMRRRR